MSDKIEVAAHPPDNGAAEGRLHSVVGRLVELGEFYIREASDDDRYEWNVAKAEARRLLGELAALSQRDEMLIWIAGEIQERVGWPSEWPETPNEQAEASGARGRSIANPDAPAALPPARG